MVDPGDERRYAWRMIRAARRAHAEGASPERVRAGVSELLTDAMEAGLDRAEIVAELAELGGRLLLLCDPAGDSDDETPGLTPDQSVNA